MWVIGVRHTIVEIGISTHFYGIPSFLVYYILFSSYIFLLVLKVSPISDLSHRSHQRLTADQIVEAALAQAQEMKHSRRIKISSPFVDDMVRDIVMNAKGSQSRIGDSLSSESTDLAFDC